LNGINANGVGVDAEVYKTIPALKKASMIRRVGPTKGGYWEVSEQKAQGDLCSQSSSTT
jgi:hypothetical protein